MRAAMGAAYAAGSALREDSGKDLQRMSGRLAAWRISRRSLARLGLGAATSVAVFGCQPVTPSRRLARVGFLGTGLNSIPGSAETLKSRLQELGWTEGETVEHIWRHSDGSEPRLCELARELSSLVDVVGVDSEPPPRAKLKARTTMPIVLVAHPDPVAAGLAVSLQRPGGQVTGTGGSQALFTASAPSYSRSSCRAWPASASATALAALQRDQVEGANWRQAAKYIDMILRSATPAELPMERGNVWELSVNATTATALGLSLSPSFASQVTRWVD
jgi:hypothetical protein